MVRAHPPRARKRGKREGGADSDSVGTLYLLATPIGNLDDITLRALQVLEAVKWVAAEDTRRTRSLLTHHGLQGKRLVSIHAHSTAQERSSVVDTLLAGESVVYATDAGTPSISDPGAALVADCRERGAKVTVLPGPSAVTAAVAVSGLGEGGFWFLGFLPRHGKKRRELLDRCTQTPEALVLFESPERMQATLSELATRMPERRICITRELTKLYEESILGTLREVGATPRDWRGELTLVVGAQPASAELALHDDDQLDELIQAQFAAGASVKDLVKSLAQRAGVPKKELYARALALLGSSDRKADLDH